MGVRVMAGIDTETVRGLPDGSIVATRTKAWIRTWPSASSPWRCTNGGYYGDTVLARELADEGGGVVLRHGYGGE